MANEETEEEKEREKGQKHLAVHYLGQWSYFFPGNPGN